MAIANGHQPKMGAKSSPGAGPTGASASRPEPKAGPPITIERIKIRADFLRAAEGRKQGTPAFLLQMTAMKAPRAEVARVGYTVTKRLGNAVVRNRARRRLKEAARLVLPLYARPGSDYVLVGRAEALTRPLSLLMDDLKAALAKIHRESREKRAQPES
jgi:ribonuclease P protein component